MDKNTDKNHDIQIFHDVPEPPIHDDDALLSWINFLALQNIMKHY